MKVALSKQILTVKSVRLASNWYKFALEENKQKQTEAEKRWEEREIITKKINEATTAAKKRALDSINRTISSYDEQIQNLKKRL